jgi:hypothetical protein
MDDLFAVVVVVVIGIGMDWNGVAERRWKMEEMNGKKDEWWKWNGKYRRPVWR